MIACRGQAVEQPSSPGKINQLPPLAPRTRCQKPCCLILNPGNRPLIFVYPDERQLNFTNLLQAVGHSADEHYGDLTQC